MEKHHRTMTYREKMVLAAEMINEGKTYRDVANAMQYKSEGSVSRVIRDAKAQGLIKTGSEWGREVLAEKDRADKAEALVRELVEALKKAHEYIGDINSFYGQGLQVHGWHFNGAPEPLDNFIDSNGGCETEEFVGRVLTKVKEVLGDE